ncbi:cell division protein FtsQ/DivIB [Syntrophus aciditrophicus]|uniref:Cell division protein n=1 Tax=Syntrophus aciditrophicus (strain SB) TaxID=56780 RepID=Q2LR55_SYNAS|nr:cell division protein FtsQ/DivIB [Syntrophus aciditrophicus]ABC76563.1 cell division protein [Syntrophus aciditrophicus SB]OPY18360.1 MAG: Cell division protein DivIB [Syntrophus sp. PtaB.Bin075]
MKRAFTRKLEAKKYRLKRRSRTIFVDIFRSILLIVVILLTGAVLIFAFNFTISAPCFRVRETVVRGCRELTEKEVLLLGLVSSSQNLLALNEKALERRISANPWIKSVSIGRELPGRLVVQIQERSVIAAIRQGSNLYLMDQEGVIFKKLDKNDESDLPVLTGFYQEGKLNELLLKNARTLINDLSSSKYFPTIDSVSEIQGNEVLGISVFTDNGLCLVLGVDDYGTKLQRLSPILEDLERRQLKEGFLRIDLRNPLKVTVSKRNIPAPRGLSDSRQEYKT